MSRSFIGAVLAAACLAVSPLAAQQTKPDSTKPKPAMDHRMDHGAMDHGKTEQGKMACCEKKGEAKPEVWKELDAYHELMMATWHPAKEKSDLAPIRAKAADMVASAKVVAASKAPASCGGKAEIKTAQAALPAETEKVAQLVTAKAADAELKAALKTLHDKFDVLEHGCGGMKH